MGKIQSEKKLEVKELNWGCEELGERARIYLRLGVQESFD